MTVCAKITVKGVVQGVGFRYFAQQNAVKFQLKGYVKNLFNGDVETEVEGDKGNIMGYYNTLKIGSRFSHVTAIDIRWCEYSAKYNSFKVVC